MRSATKHMLLEAMQGGALVLGIVAVIYFFDDIHAVFRPNGLPPLAQALRDRPGDSKEKESGFDHEVRLRADANGHFVFKAAVNGRLADVVADTGATYVVITYDDAERLGLSPHTLDFSAPVQTANDVTRVAPVTLTVCVWTTSRSATCPPPWPKRARLPPISSA